MKSKYKVTIVALDPSMKLKAVPKTTCHSGAKNSLAKTYPTVVLPDVTAPAIVILIIVVVILLLKYRIAILMHVMTIDPQKIHLLPILSAIKGTKRIVQVHPMKKDEPINPIVLELAHTRSICSTQLCRLVWLL